MLCQQAGLSESKRIQRYKMKKFQSTSSAWLGVWDITQPYDTQSSSACICTLDPLRLPTWQRISWGNWWGSVSSGKLIPWGHRGDVERNGELFYLTLISCRGIRPTSLGLLNYPVGLALAIVPNKVPREASTRWALQTETLKQTFTTAAPISLLPPNVLTSGNLLGVQ